MKKYSRMLLAAFMSIILICVPMITAAEVILPEGDEATLTNELVFMDEAAPSEEGVFTDEAALIEEAAIEEESDLAEDAVFVEEIESAEEVLSEEVTEPAEETIPGEEEEIPQHLNVASATHMNGNFFTDLWGYNTSDLDVQALLKGYNLVIWNGNEGMFVTDPSVVSGLTVVENNNGDRTYLITLYDDLYFSDETPIDAWDYAFSWLLLCSDEIGGLGVTPADYSWLVGFEEYKDGTRPYLEGITILEDDTLAITVKNEALPFFYELGLLSCVPYPIQTIAPGVKVFDDGYGVYLANDPDWEEPEEEEETEETGETGEAGEGEAASEESVDAAKEPDASGQMDAAAETADDVAESDASAAEEQAENEATDTEEPEADTAIDNPEADTEEDLEEDSEEDLEEEQEEEPRFTTELLMETILDPETGYLSHPAVVSGPYLLTSWDGDVAEFEANPYYKGDLAGRLPTMDTLTYLCLENENMIDALEAGEIDLLNKVTASETILAGIELYTGRERTVKEQPSEEETVEEETAEEEQAVEEETAWEQPAEEESISEEEQSAEEEIISEEEETTGEEEPERRYGMSNYTRTGLTYISFSRLKETVSSLAVRQAIAWCMDRDEVMNSYTGNYGIRVDGYYGLGQWMYRLAIGNTQPSETPPEDENDTAAMEEYEARLAAWDEINLDSLTVYDRDLEKARTLLDDNGWSLNEEGLREQDGVVLDLVMVYPEGSRIEEAFEEYLIPNLEEVGIRLTLVPLPMEELLLLYYEQLETDFGEEEESGTAEEDGESMESASEETEMAEAAEESEPVETEITDLENELTGDAEQEELTEDAEPEEQTEEIELEEIDMFYLGSNLDALFEPEYLYEEYSPRQPLEDTTQYTGGGYVFIDKSDLKGEQALIAADDLQRELSQAASYMSENAEAYVKEIFDAADSAQEEETTADTESTSETVADIMMEEVTSDEATVEAASDIAAEEETSDTDDREISETEQLIMDLTEAAMSRIFGQDEEEKITEESGDDQENLEPASESAESAEPEEEPEEETPEMLRLRMLNTYMDIYNEYIEMYRDYGNIYVRALDMRETEPGETLEYMQKWLRFQELINEYLPIIPIYSNVYFDFYIGELEGYNIAQNITWGNAVLGTRIRVEEEEEEPETVSEIDSEMEESADGGIIGTESAQAQPALESDDSLFEIID